jgi:hypothetical protein
MRDSKITVTKFNNILITAGRYAPLQTTVIVKLNNQTIEPISLLKQEATDMLGTLPTVPRDSPTVPFY